MTRRIQRSLTYPWRMLVALSVVIGAVGCSEDKPGTSPQTDPTAEQIPAGTYAEACSIIPPPFRTEKDGRAHLRMLVVVHLKENGTLHFNEEPITDAILRRLVTEWNDFSVTPQVILDIEPNVPCERVAEIRKLLAATELCREKPLLCGEGHNPENWPDN